MPQNPEIDNRGRIIRIMQKDIEGRMKLYPGLTKIKGISWSLSNAVCKKLGFDKNRTIESLSESEIKKLEEFLKAPEIPKFLKNRQKDFETGEDGHLIGSNLELRKEFDIKRLKKIKSYKGYRHVAGLPVRGQRTRAHFRKNRARGAGIKKK
ncbi:MAG: 30S ribosomal protein S13 [Nanoarchaeota archaeon]|nr:30S ribosomal protein S13 [Nanoarchaeota archaeon]